MRSRQGDRSEEELHRARMHMVTRQIEARGITDAALLQALRQVERHRFVSDVDPLEAYEDHPLAIGRGQTISQPYVVAFMTEALRLEGGERVLEVGTGSGYQAAVLAELGVEVHSIEIDRLLHERASALLEDLGYPVQLRYGDAYHGWPEEAPFDAILVTAAPPIVPPALLEQLAPAGRLILPVGERVQELRLFRRTPAGVEEVSLLPVRFVPMTGLAQESREGAPKD